MYLSAESIIRMLDSYRKKNGDRTKVRYYVRKRLGKVELRLFIPGEKHDPFADDEQNTRSSVERALKPLLVNRTQYYSHYYVHGTNVLVVSSPPIKKKSLFRSPMLWAAILGLAAGFLCL